MKWRDTDKLLKDAEGVADSLAREECHHGERIVYGYDEDGRPYRRHTDLEGTECTRKTPFN